MKHLSSIAFTIVLCSCSTTPTATYYGPRHGTVDGFTTQRADPDIYSIKIVSVDGELYPDLPSRLSLKPGFHWLQVASTKTDFRGGFTYQPLPLNVEPCTNYRFVAKHDKSLSNRHWQVVENGKTVDENCPAE